MNQVIVNKSKYSIFVSNFQNKNIMGCQGGNCIHLVG